MSKLGRPILVTHRLIAAALSSFFLLTQFGHGAPILPPDLRQCHPTIARPITGAPGVTFQVNCCLPLPKKKIVEFSFEEYPGMRIRRPAHRADREYIEKYNKAYELMKALPPDDPRSFMKQADIHCAFCNGAYTERGRNLTLQMHFSWLFLPWHRWYLYFHERILGSLIGDPSFALPFWNWDNQEDGNVIPFLFTKKGTALYDSKRNQKHLPPTLVSLNVLSNNTQNLVIIQENLNVMYQSMVTASTAELFMGGAYRASDSLDASTVLHAPLAGSLEFGPHDSVHGWTGDPRQPLQEDMGVFYSSARDPLFYAHHTNVDRLWKVWRSIPGKRRRDHTDPDFLNAEFLFYNEKAELVKVKVRDALDSAKLGVDYEQVKADRLWLEFSPQPLSNGSASSSVSSKVKEIGSAAKNKKRRKVGKKLSAIVARPATASSSTEAVKRGGLVEVLVLEGVEIPRNTFVQLVVFINLPDADEKTTISSAEYVGTFTNIPHAGKGRSMIIDIKFEIGDNIRRIGMGNAKKVVVTVVLKGHASDIVVKIKGMKIEYA